MSKTIVITPESIQAAKQDILAAIDLFWTERGRGPSHSELSEATGVNKAHIYNYLCHLRATGDVNWAQGQSCSVRTTNVPMDRVPAPWRGQAVAKPKPAKAATASTKSEPAASPPPTRADVSYERSVVAKRLLLALYRRELGELSFPLKQAAMLEPVSISSGGVYYARNTLIANRFIGRDWKLSWRGTQEAKQLYRVADQLPKATKVKAPAPKKTSPAPKQHPIAPPPPKPAPKPVAVLTKGGLIVDLFLTCAVDLFLTCAKCGKDHLDDAHACPHIVHVCHNCGHAWQPAVGPSRGVPFPLG